MVFFSKLDRSADLVKGMATRIGYDVSDPAHAPLFKQMVFAWRRLFGSGRLCTPSGGC